ncbi:stage II sporulation protein GA (sporulation sigma-E factor processing peptidase) [Alteribacillus iranensis]|uniref:Sporulation sigma-E factor-processing peptidase n=1 Tax=Alteribacillus iranensis TaxID=930128 RepID=A0A1I2AB46_9BACI|nr:stage II sporulation protein GA (sporulation sigma-E factor processing peptidase) [Alteribacillus iranensis]
MLTGTARLLKRKITKKRLWFVSLLGSCTIFFVLTPWESWLFHPFGKALLTIVLVWLAFGYSSLYMFAQSVFMFYMTSFLAAGTILALETWRYSIQEHYIAISHYVQSMYSSFSLILIVLSIPGIWLIFYWTDSIIKKRKVKMSKLAHVVIEAEGVSLEGKALVDTGNELKDPITRVPVMVMQISHLRKIWPMDEYETLHEVVHHNRLEQLSEITHWKDRWRFIPYRSAGQDMKMMVAFKPDRVAVEDEEISTFDSILVGLETRQLSSSNDFTMIFPSDPLETSKHATA